MVTSPNASTARPRNDRLNFLPIFLFEQLNPWNKFANFYFGCVSILQCIPAISITGSVPTTLARRLLTMDNRRTRRATNPEPRLPSAFTKKKKTLECANPLQL